MVDRIQPVTVEAGVDVVTDATIYNYKDEGVLLTLQSWVQDWTVAQ